MKPWALLSNAKDAERGIGCRSGKALGPRLEAGPQKVRESGLLGVGLVMQPLRAHSSQPRPCSAVLCWTLPPPGAVQKATPTAGPQSRSHHPWVRLVLSPPCSLASQPWPAQGPSHQELLPQDSSLPRGRVEGGEAGAGFGLPSSPALPLQERLRPGHLHQVVSLGCLPLLLPRKDSDQGGSSQASRPCQVTYRSERWSLSLGRRWKRQAAGASWNLTTLPQAPPGPHPSEASCQQVFKREQK